MKLTSQRKRDKTCQGAGVYQQLGSTCLQNAYNK